MRATEAAEPAGVRRCRSPRSRWTCHWPISTGPSTTWCPSIVADAAEPGCRVKVRFAGAGPRRLRAARADEADHVGRLSPLRKVVSAEQVLPPAGRSSLPGRSPTATPARSPTCSDWRSHPGTPRSRPSRRRCADRPARRSARRPARPDGRGGGRAGLDRPAGARRAPARRLDAHPPGSTGRLARRSAAAAVRLGPGEPACWRPTRVTWPGSTAPSRALLGPGAHVVLTADLGPAARYRAFLAVSRGVVPTRGRHPRGRLRPGADPRAGRAVGRRRRPVRRAAGAVPACARGAAAAGLPRASRRMLIGAHSRSVEAQALVESGWASELTRRPRVVRAAAPQVQRDGETDADWSATRSARSARMPAQVFSRGARGAGDPGPVLVHTPRFGYLPALACARCRSPARCPRCSGPAGPLGSGMPVPSVVAAASSPRTWACPHCGGNRLRAPVVGSLRTAEEWGRSFPPRPPVATSGGDHVLDEVDGPPEPSWSPRRAPSRPWSAATPPPYCSTPG